MIYIKLYFIIGVLVGLIFELLYWFIKNDLDKNEHRYFKKYGGFSFVFIWPYIIYIILISIIQKH